MLLNNPATPSDTLSRRLMHQGTGASSGDSIPPAPPAIYVDSVGGNDANDGLSSAAPVQTLATAKIVAIAEGLAVFFLKRDSHFRESLALNGFTAPQVSSYGTTGALPIIDGSDVITGWTAYTAGGVAHMYQKSVANEAGTTGRLTVYENGVPLVRVENDALCDATAGTFVNTYSGSNTPNPATVKIHPFGSTNASSDGKLYEAAVRSVALQGADGGSVSGIETGKCTNNNGSTDLVNCTGADVQRVLMTYGTKHNGGIGSGRMKDCIAYLSDPGTPQESGRNPFVAFLEDATGETALFEQSGAVGPNAIDFYAHSLGALAYSAVNAVQLWTVDSYSYTGGFTLNEGSYYRAVLTTPTAGGTSSMIMVRLTANSQVGGFGTVGFPSTVQDSVFYALKKSNNNEIFRPAGPSVITNCVFYAEPPIVGVDNGSVNVQWFSNASADQDTEMSYSIVFNGTNLMQVNAGAYAGDHNIFLGSNGWNMADEVNFQHSSGYKSTLASWQSATSQDSNSVRVARADQVAGGANALWLAWANASGGTDLSTIGPAVGDLRINPSARVYSGAGTAYIGTFPDLVPITNAGPQNRWDWNARASASGAPLRWPEPPDTLAECRTYILNPAGWNFYP